MNEFDLQLDKTFTIVRPTDPPYNGGEQSGDEGDQYYHLHINATSTIPDTRLDIEGGESGLKIHVNQSTDQSGPTSYEINVKESYVIVEDRTTLDNAQTHQYNYSIDSSSRLEFSETASADIFEGNSDTQIDIGWDGFSATGPTVVFNVNENFDVSNLENTPTISNFGANSELLVNLNGGGTISSLYDENSQELQFFNDTGINIAKFHFEGNFDSSLLRVDDGRVYYACFLKGTHIATPDGETKVEDLELGDQVLTASGGIAKVKWLGYRTLYKNRIPEKDAKRAFPILFKKGCIEDNVPHRDLIMSPGHHISFGGKLVSAMHLVNGKSIVQLFDMPSFQYFHVELQQFDILLAEGVPAESYVDTGNRNMFQNAYEVALNPDFGPATGRPDVPGITVVRTGQVLEAIRAKLLERANLMQVLVVQKRSA